MATMSTSLGEDLEAALEAHRRELTGFCYRMLGAGSEAEDAVQETMVRAWRSIDGFEGRSSLRSWLYRIANNVCIDMLRSPQRRARPMDMGPSTPVAEVVLGEGRPPSEYVQPVADGRVIATDGDPGDVAAARESIRLAFVAALQRLPARQRSALILCDVLRWHAAEDAGAERRHVVFAPGSRDQRRVFGRIEHLVQRLVAMLGQLAADGDERRGIRRSAARLARGV